MPNIQVLTDSKGDLLAIAHGENPTLTQTPDGKQIKVSLVVPPGHKLTPVPLTPELEKLSPLDLHKHLSENIHQFVH